MKKNISAFMLAFIMLFGLIPFAGASGETDYYYGVCYDEKNAFLLNDKDNVFICGEDGKPKGDPVANIERETQFPYVYNGELYVLDKAKEQIIELYPETKPGETLNIESEIANGASDWYAQSVCRAEDTLYFILSFSSNNDTLLCSCNIKDKTSAAIELEGLIAYMPGGELKGVAVCERGGDRLLYTVDWQNEQAEEAIKLKGVWSSFAWDSAKDMLYAADVENSEAVCFENFKENHRIFTPYAGTYFPYGALLNGEYCILNREGLAEINFSVEKSEEKILTLGKSAGNKDWNMEFMKLHPNVKIQEAKPVSDEVDEAVAIIGGLTYQDVGEISNIMPMVEKLIEKGYFMDLSKDEELVELVNKMYKPIRDFAFVDGKLLMVPYNIDLSDSGINFEINEDLLKKAGFAKEEFPKTMEGLLDLLIEWQEEHKDIEDGEPVILANDIYKSNEYSLLIHVLASYSSYYRRKGEDLTFDTPLFRRLLEKTRLAHPAIYQFFDGQPKHLPIVQYYDNYRIKSMLTFPISEDERPVYGGRVWCLAVDPRTKEPELAVEYIKFIMTKLAELKKMMLFDGEYEPLERADYKPGLEKLEEKLKLYEDSYNENDNEIEKREIQSKIDDMKAIIENYNKNSRYEYTKEDIAYYQNEVVPKLDLYFSNDVITESSYENSGELKTLLKRYTEGQLDMDGFIRALDNREKLRRLEDQ